MVVPERGACWALDAGYAHICLTVPVQVERRGRGEARQTWLSAPKYPSALASIPAAWAGEHVSSPQSPQLLPKVSICPIFPTTLFKRTLNYAEKSKVWVNSHPLYCEQGPVCDHT